MSTIAAPTANRGPSAPALDSEGRAIGELSRALADLSELETGTWHIVSAARAGDERLGGGQPSERPTVRG